MHAPELTVVLPARNEEKSIAHCVLEIKKVFEKGNLSGEIIVVDNASEDRTAGLALSSGATVIEEKGVGYGSACASGMKKASGKFIILGDADNSYSFSEIPVLLAQLRAGSDVVLGSRFKGTIKKNSMPWLNRHIGNPFLNFCFNLFFRTSFTDTHSGFRGISSSAFKRLSLNQNGMEFALEFIIASARNCLMISEVPISYSPRIGKSKLSPFSDGFRHFFFLLRERLKRSNNQ
jgi:glycosyltransferase involved in cell wall biosynthesis